MLRISFVMDGGVGGKADGCGGGPSGALLCGALGSGAGAVDDEAMAELEAGLAKCERVQAYLGLSCFCRS